MAKILVVDDDLSILEAISLLLRDMGHTVKTSDSGEGIEKIATQFSPDIMLLDILLSGSDGRDLCKKLKLNPKTKNIPLVMISAHPSASTSIKECGADAFLAKPFEFDQLVNLISKYTDKN